ncbi:MAG TPA: four helix bundle protein [Terracidiphilus sp.]
MEIVQDYHDLICGQKAIDLTVCVHKMTQSFPKSEIDGITSQMRRANVSAASNIAEGRGRLNLAEFRQFLGIEQGSVFELQTQHLVSKSLGFAFGDSFDEAEVLSSEVSKILSTFIQKLTPQTRASRLADRVSGIAIRS